jgi:hypothetical protein
MIASRSLALDRGERAGAGDADDDRQFAVHKPHLHREGAQIGGIERYLQLLHGLGRPGARSRRGRRARRSQRTRLIRDEIGETAQRDRREPARTRIDSRTDDSKRRSGRTRGGRACRVHLDRRNRSRRRMLPGGFAIARLRGCRRPGRRRRRGNGRSAGRGCRAPLGAAGSHGQRVGHCQVGPRLQALQT